MPKNKVIFLLLANIFKKVKLCTKTKLFIPYFTWARRCSTIFCRAGPQQMSWLLAKTSFISSNAFTLSSFSQASVMRDNIMCDMEYPWNILLVQFKLTVLQVHFQPLWCWDPLPDIGTEWEKQTSKQKSKQKNALMLCKRCSARAKTAVCYQYCISHKSKTQHHSTIQTAIRKIHFIPGSVDCNKYFLKHLDFKIHKLYLGFH